MRPSSQLSITVAPFPPSSDETVRLTVPDTYTIFNFKQSLSYHVPKNVFASDIDLVFSETRVPLDDNKSLRKCGITNKTVLYYIIKEKDIGLPKRNLTLTPAFLLGASVGIGRFCYLAVTSPQPYDSHIKSSTLYGGGAFLACLLLRKFYSTLSADHGNL